MKKTSILDCTLRDGGYINDWEFQSSKIENIIKNLVLSGVDYIECGFLKNIEYVKDKTLFSKIEYLEKYLPVNNAVKYTLMINFGEYEIDDIPDFQNGNIGFRLAFKKNQKNEAIAFAQKLIEKGYFLSLNPMHTNIYSDEELFDLINDANNIKPDVLAIVDTAGVMNKKDVLRLYYLMDNNLNKNIAICFHLHNNLQLSFSNAQALIEANQKRGLIIDSSLYGMGRGAGNLCTELLMKYLNENHGANYDINPILKTIDEIIAPIFTFNPWGYQLPYFLSALNEVHPNYAKYLLENGVNSQDINLFLQKIPKDKKTNFDKNEIEKIYLKEKVIV